MIKFTYTSIAFLISLMSFAQLNETFTDGDYTNNPVWTSIAPTDFSVNASSQLASANTVTNTSFYISTPNTLANNCTWEFWINIKQATSGSNYVDAYLTADNVNLLSSTLNGYFVRIGNTNDDVSLYKNVNGIKSILIDGVNATVASSTNNLIKIKVTRSSTNVFTLERDMTGLGTSYVTEGTPTTDATHTTSANFGFLVVQSTASFFGKHFFDDISISQDITAPTIVSNTILSSTALDVLFNENLDATSAQVLTNYNVNNGIANPTTALRDATNNALVHLTFANPFANNTLNTLTVTGVQDLFTNAITTQTTAFTYTTDVTAPTVINSTVINSADVDVLFSESITLASAQATTNYSANNGLANPTSATRDASNLALVHLSFAPTVFANATANTLTITNVQDIALNTIVTTTITFTYFAPITVGFKDIIVSEIMAAPSTVINAFRMEYVELFNKSANPIDLNGFKIADTYAGTGATIGTYVLQPNSYVAICTTNSVTNLMGAGLGYTNVIGVASFPSLSNTGDDVYLKSSTGSFIDSVNYLDTWYRNTTKKAGGWSLELINPNANNNCLQANNWIASNGTDGGTPGKVNSVYNITPDVFGPRINGVTVIDSTHVLVCFNDVIATSQLNNNLNYVINNAIGSPALATASSDNLCVTLTLATALQNATNYTLTINGITDCNGNALTPNNQSFSRYTAKPYDVVINELMPDPDPAQSLPNEEYVELKNRTNFNINLKNWKFSSLTTTGSLPNVTIPANGYVVLAAVGTNDVFYNNFGVSVAEVVSFPSLLNSGTTLSLKDSNDVVINAITYSLTWYNDNNKKDGGWSMEQIDANNPCGGQSNWHASTNTNGGTPGAVNSVAATNADATNPTLDRINIIDADTIMLVFSESLSYATLLNPTNYTFDNGLTTPTYIMPVAPDYKKVIVKLSAPMQIGITYNCTVLNAITDCVGNPLTLGTAAFALPQQPKANDVVINEILFDPNTNGVDFVELYNRSNKVIDLKNLRIGSMDTLTGNLTYTELITTDGYLLFPKTYLVLSENQTIVKQQYQTINPTGFLDVATLPSMNTTDDVVTLSSDSFVVVDNFKYTSKLHFPLLNITKGVSLERIDFNRATDDRTNWNSAAEGVGFATPAYKNSQYLLADGGSGVTIPSPLFSPDNDGYNDVLNISYKLDEIGKAANVYIYDSKGRQVRYLIRNQQLADEGVFSWNGINDDNEKAAIGIYVVYVELFNLNGKTNKYKLVCTLAGKL